MKWNGTNRRRGFTLIEVLMALGIFSLLIAALYSTWVLVMRATIVGKGTAARLQRERIAVSTIEDSLTCIQSHQASINYYLFEVQNGDQPYLSFAAYLPDTFPRSGEFSGQNPDGVYMDYHLRRLTFSMQPDGQGTGNDLVVRQNPILMNMSQSEQDTPLVLAKNVTTFLIECWDTNAMQWDSEWDATNMLPPLVRVTLAFGDPASGNAQVITREISFPSSTMPSQVQTPNFNNGGLGNPGNIQTPYNPYGPGGGNGGQSGVSSGGTFRPQSYSIPGQPPNLGPPLLPTAPPSHSVPSQTPI